MAHDECLEMTVVEESGSSTESKHPIDEQKDEIIFRQTESHSSAGGLIEVYKPHESSTTPRLAIDNGPLGIYSTSRDHQLWFHTASRMGSVGPLYPIQLTQWRSGIAGLWKSASWLWILPHCIIVGRNGVDVR